MRLIDADPLIKIAYEYDDFMVDGHDILDAPTIDAVPVVRCGECKYYVLPKRFCYVVQGMPKEDFYCAAGKRRDTD